MTVSAQATIVYMPDLEWIRKLCRSLPDVTEDMPWDDDLCFKVRGKIFTGVLLSDGRFPRITLKCTPEAFHELLEVEGISIAPYVGRYNWVTLAISNVLPTDELEFLIRRSYDLVAAKAPKKSVKLKRDAKKKASIRA
ncbi:MAG TPA: MmcQ/YjbR family DNA-binding protein [Terriglobales bacterium]|nr:MmcQ/YjbR family DNA-binding protein [Terriglobales bacterium]